jgi:hypothetical protein
MLEQTKEKFNGGQGRNYSWAQQDHGPPQNQKFSIFVGIYTFF